MNKPTICLDFDGVIHKYSKGWQNGEIYDDITDGFIEWAEEAAKHFTLVVYSSRSKTPEGIAMMKTWLRQKIMSHFEWNFTGAKNLFVSFEFASTKPAAWLTIDDRCIRFDGDWNAITIEQMKDFKPWNK